eukprot:scaffold1190_cov187-Ochromonas_danica.AAC.36
MKLCLHFDINKTILIADAGSGRNFLSSLNSLLSEAVWGEFNHDIPFTDRQPQDWIPVSTTPGIYPPSNYAVTFGSYLEEHTALSKTQRRALKCHFTDGGDDDNDNGGETSSSSSSSTTISVGRLYQKDLMDLQRHLTIPSDIPINNNEDITNSFYKDGYYHILPSFFHLINYLVELQQQQHDNDNNNNNTNDNNRLDFRIIFRTFGIDIIEIAKEFNMFCEGKHPFFQPKYPLDGSQPDRYPRDLRLHLPLGHAVLRRTGQGPMDIHLAHLDSSGSLVTVTSGYQAIHEIIMKDWLQLDSSSTEGNEDEDRKEKSRYTIAIRDDYQWWDKNGESDTSGKLFFVNSEEVETMHHAVKTNHKMPLLKKDHQERVIELFFDDNIERHRAHIVDVRDSATFNPVPFALTSSTVLHKVEPYLSITDPEYFIKIVRDVLSRYDWNQ